mmetsp:Transcript_136970/g.355753  ORF Transcript_136970/g.355753 Transcript_136970/m.355753 type:complete len:110 (+) Transcript_136970:163-492(+)
MPVRSPLCDLVLNQDNFNMLSSSESPPSRPRNFHAKPRPAKPHVVVALAVLQLLTCANTSRAPPLSLLGTTQVSGNGARPPERASFTTTLDINASGVVTHLHMEEGIPH